MLPPISDLGRASHRATTTMRWAGVATVVALCLSLAPSPAAAEPTPTPTPTSTPTSTPTPTDGATVPATGAAPAPVPQEPLTARVRESLDHLMTTYGVDEGEALRRLRLQADAPDLVELVRRQVGEDLIHVHLDQAEGGRLVFRAVDPARVTAALGSRFDPAQMATVKSRFTAAQLRAAEAEVRGRLRQLPKADAHIDAANERIAVVHRVTDPALATRTRQLAGVRTAAGVPIAVDTSPPRAVTQYACALFACDVPIRGGIRLHVRRDNGTWGSCTAGFNIRDNTGAAFVLTAGHCVRVPGPNRQFLYHNGLPAVVEVNASGSFTDPNAPVDGRFSRNEPPARDYALLPFQVTGTTNWHQYWLTNRTGRNLVFHRCVTPTSGTCQGGTGNHAIIGVRTHEQMVTGSVLCATGTGFRDLYPDNGAYVPGTRCGGLEAKNMVNYDNAGSGGLGLKVRICGRNGDSGGPLFSQLDARAYGILSGGPARTGACSLSDSGDYGVYSPVSVILSHASAQTGRTMSVISSSNG